MHAHMLTFHDAWTKNALFRTKDALLLNLQRALEMRPVHMAIVDSSVHQGSHPILSTSSLQRENTESECAKSG
jgi:hypothetical protein